MKLLCRNCDILEEKVSCEIRESPSMMWKRSIVQATTMASCGHAAATLALWLVLLIGAAHGADLVIEIPGSSGAAGGQYRLDYVPPQGSPAPNFTVPARASTINFQGLPGTKYHFMLYYSNATFADLLTWNQTIITAPEPPTNLTVTLGRNKQATISWSPPANGDYTGFRFKVIPLSEREAAGAEGARNITVEGAGNWTHALRDLAPGGTYQLHAFTLLQDKESAAYASRNFTTKPNTPGKFIVWFRNETTLLVLWQPPYPPGAYTHYKVSIVPPDARDSELYVEKEGEPPGPAQAAFKGLVPGRAYNISVQTVSEPEISAPTTAQYRTVPLRPRDVSAVDVGETAFTVLWAPPLEHSEFEKYQVSVSGGAAGSRRLAPVLRLRNETARVTCDGLQPGGHYQATVKTMSGKVTSWPATADVTLKPLAVLGLAWQTAARGVLVSWRPAPGSAQDEFRIVYHEAGPTRDDSSSLTVSAPANNVTLDTLLPGRNYTVTVAAASRGVESSGAALWLATRPLAPVLRRGEARARSLSLAWRSDVDSQQQRYELRYRQLPRSSEHPQMIVETKETNITLEDLYPGAVYEIEVAAVSHGLRSDTHPVYKPVRPLPPTWLSVERSTSNSVVVRWRGAAGGRVGAYVLRHRAGDAAWERPRPLPSAAAQAEIANMTHGERYEIQLDTVSEGDDETVESGQPLTQYHTVRPNPVSNVAQLADTRNLTLEWPRPLGLVQLYSIEWTRQDPPGETMSRNVSAAAAGAGRTVRCVLEGLAPGAGYGVAIAAHAHGLASDLFRMATRTRPLILSEMTIVTESNGDDNETEPGFKVIYTRTPLSATQFDTYRFRLDGEGEAGGEAGGAAEGGAGDAAGRVVERAADAAGQQVAFRPLVAGRLYNVTMWTVSRNVSSHPVQRQARLFPRSITDLKAVSIGATEISLAWEKPLGVYTDFTVTYLADADRLETSATTDTHLTLTGLQPFTLYTFTVEVRAGTAATLLTRSRAVSGAFRTLEGRPAAPANLRVLHAAPAALTLAWELPARARRGRVRRVLLAHAPSRQPAARAAQALPPDATNATITGLQPGEEYEFSVWAETGAGAGPPARTTQRMAIAAPPRPKPEAIPSEARRSTTAVAVRFRADYFSAANGNVTAYTLVVAQEPRNDTPARLPSWRDVHALPVWPPYQVTEPYYPFHSRAVEEFTIGSETCSQGGRTYCNGPLKPGAKYYVKLRAFTDKDKFTDTAYTVVYTEVDNTAWIAGGATAALALAAGGAALLLLRRRARAPPTAPPAPASRLSRPVRVADFREHYREMSADSDFRFSEEFEELKHVGREQPCTAADLPCNRPKNRFTNILPYDHSRYKLQPVDDEEGSDYINANYVPGHNSPREFIVTQGPLHCTRDDFWRMCWESGSRALVMLTRCVEKGREKCDRYWPFDTRPVYYGDIAVTALNESRYPDWTVTELMVSRGAEQRVVKHFHFTTWPDFGVPDPPTTLVRFVRAFRERCGADSRPVVVHCSAGVGRSGTFITLDTALQQLAAGAETLDIFGMVRALRRERVWMVQTEQQYICIHTCLVAVLEGQDLPPPPPHHHNPAFDDDEGIAESGM